jgi:hypothetical protein
MRNADYKIVFLEDDGEKFEVIWMKSDTITDKGFAYARDAIEYAEGVLNGAK